MLAMDDERFNLLREACGKVTCFAPGWDKDLLLRELIIFVGHASEKDFDKRKKVSRLARKLLAMLDQRDPDDLDLYVALEKAAAPPPRNHAGGSKRGGDRRSGEHTWTNHVLRMCITYFWLASKKPTFSRTGSLVRFVNLVGEAVLGEVSPFKPDAVGSEFHRLRPNLRRELQARAVA
jgi:hypothetical protein